MLAIRKRHNKSVGTYKTLVYQYKWCYYLLHDNNILENLLPPRRS